MVAAARNYSKVGSSNDDSTRDNKHIEVSNGGPIISLINNQFKESLLAIRLSTKGKSIVLNVRDP